MVDLFKCLPQKKRDDIQELVTRVSYKPGDTIFQQGAPALGIYLLYQGHVKLCHRTVDGKKMIFRIVGPGDVLGVPALFNNENYAAYAKAIEESEVGFLKRGDLFDFFRKHAGLLIEFCKWLSSELRAFQLKLVENSYCGSKQRICRLLAQTNLADSPVSRESLAQMTGVSYKTVIQVISELEQRDLIRAQDGRIRVEKPKELENIAVNFPIEMRQGELM